MEERQGRPWCREIFMWMYRMPNIMRLVFLFWIISFMGFTANATAQRITIMVENVEMEEILEIITEQTGLAVAYSEQVVDMDRKVSVHIVNVELPGGTRLSAMVSDGSGEMELVFFKGLKWVSEKMKPGNEFIFFGKPASFNGRINMVHPDIDPVPEGGSQGGGRQGADPAGQGRITIR